MFSDKDIENYTSISIILQKIAKSKDIKIRIKKSLSKSSFLKSWLHGPYFPHFTSDDLLIEKYQSKECPLPIN